MPKADKKETKKLEVRAYSFFVVVPNPRVHGVAGISAEEMAEMDNQRICDLIVEAFCDKRTKQAAVLYCKSAAGLEHLHCVLSSDNQLRWSTLKKFLGSAAHIKVTRGSKEQVEAYIHKDGAFAEKGEEILAMAQIGEIKGRQGQRADVERIREAIDAGMSWRDVCRLDDKFYENRYMTMIKNMFFDKRNQETPFKRQVSVHWLFGDSGSGKTGITFELIKKYGEDDVYIVSDYQNPFDGYAGEQVIVMDEYRGQLSYATLLGMLEGYKKEIHCRYANVTGLWTEVYITTVKTPEEVYAKMIDKEDAISDPISQLLGRISEYGYCYRVNRMSGTKTDRDGQPCEFYRYMVSGKDYRMLKFDMDLGDKIEQIKKAARKHYEEHYAEPGDTVEAFGIKPFI